MTLTGSVVDVIGVAYQAYLFFNPLTRPTLVDGVLVGPNFATKVAEEDGTFTINLALGTYRLTIDSINVILNIPAGGGTISLEDAINEPTVTSGGDSVGFIQTTNLTALRALPWTATYKHAWLTVPEDRENREWYWDATSLAVDDGTAESDVAKPDNRAVELAGRWLIW